ncbi:histidine phosphatase family protein [Anaerolineales bacterium HSG6]|nr:histidine phosphatase family protein [Anaerolineales bacterium HSG6]
MSNTEIILIRHGATEWNREGRFQGQLNSPLTEVGVQQAQALGARMRSEPLRAIYSSDLERSSTTATHIAQAVGLKVQIDARFRERHFGVFQGLRRNEMETLHPSAWARDQSNDPDFAAPNGGESRREVLTRSWAGIETLAERHAGEQILIVTHGGVLGVLLRHVLGIPLSSPRTFKVLNVAFNRIFLHRNGRWMASTLGDVAHLNHIVTEYDSAR